MCAKPPRANPSHGEALSAFLAGKPLRQPTRRLQLWDIDGSMQCSIIGTCLTEQDLIDALRRNKLQAANHANSYDVHSYCVRAAGQDTPLTRSLNKILDRRYEGALRIVGRTECPDELRRVWARLRDAGQIGAAYWALLSHRHVPADLKIALFGEVHMLSHLNGHGAQELSLRLAEAERRIVDIEGRLRRSNEAKMAAIAERDAAVAKLSALECRLSTTSGRVANVDRTPAPSGTRQAKTERALISARARARHAEELLAKALARQGPKTPTAPVSHGETCAALPKLEERAPPRTLRVLYLGGRPAILPHLKKAADQRQAELLHHDGGVDDNIHRIEDLVKSCDVVMCPIDCVSHGACLLAKETCHRLRKRFIPIPTSSRSGFERALDQMPQR